MRSEQPPGRPPHVKQVKGRWYWDPPDRLRRSHGLVTKPLGADQAQAWAYAVALNREHLQLGPGAPIVGSVAWVFASFFASAPFASKAASTQKDYRWLGAVLADLPVAGKTFGAVPALSVRARHADGIYAALTRDKGDHTAHYACRFARRVWHWALRAELVDANPWEKMGLRTLPARTALWTPEQVAAVIVRAQECGRPSLGLATLIGYSFGHRQADVLALTWTALEAGQVDTRKTGVRLPISAAPYPDLAAALDATHRQQIEDARAANPQRVPPAHIVIHERTGRAYNAHTFRHEWRALAASIGIGPDLQFRDLRATAETEITDSGADVMGSSTHLGHKDPRMRRRYARRTLEQFEATAKIRVEHLGKRSK